MAKPEHEFFVATTVPWTPCAGDNTKVLKERVLAADPNANVATRILRFEPGTDTTANGIQIHDFWEEVYILDGAFHDTTLNKTFKAGEYACRPPGMVHGPWTSKDGCTTFEVRYYSKEK